MDHSRWMQLYLSVIDESSFYDIIINNNVDRVRIEFGYFHCVRYFQWRYIKLFTQTQAIDNSSPNINLQWNYGFK